MGAAGILAFNARLPAAVQKAAEKRKVRAPLPLPLSLAPCSTHTPPRLPAGARGVVARDLPPAGRGVRPRGRPHTAPLVAEEVLAVAEVRAPPLDDGGRRWRRREGASSTPAAARAGVVPTRTRTHAHMMPPPPPSSNVSGSRPSGQTCRSPGCVVTEGTFARSGATLYRVVRREKTVAEVRGVGRGE